MSIVKALVRGYQAFVAPHCEYRGTVTWWRPQGFGWIGIGTVTRVEDEAANTLPTVKDIYIHEAQCSGLTVAEKMEVVFKVQKDKKRGPGTYRAYDVRVYEPPPQELDQVLTEETNAPDELQASVRSPRPLQFLDGSVWEPPEALYREVVSNQLLAGIPRDEYRRADIERVAEQARECLSTLLRDEFEPRFGRLDPSYQIDGPDAEFRTRVSNDITGMKARGALEEARQTFEDFKNFERMRNFLCRVWREGFVRPNSVLPISKLGDILLAFPVLFFDLTKQEEDEVLANADPNILDPMPHSVIEHLCGLLPAQHAKDYLQMFNLRARSLKVYRGDIIPAEVSELLGRARGHFDILFLGTPYCGFPAADWGYQGAIDIKDPIVLGLRREVPSVFFLLDRFSDDGLFPRYEEMVACNLRFLRRAREALNGLTWRHWIKGETIESRPDNRHPVGEDLVRMVEQLLMASRLGKLPLWLAGRADVRPREMNRRFLDSAD